MPVRSEVQAIYIIYENYYIQWFSSFCLMEFRFLAAVSSGLLSWGHFISSDTVDLIAQILNWIELDDDITEI